MAQQGGHYSSLPALSSRVNHVPATLSRLNLLVINDLKAICRQEGLTVSGKKADLQSRISKRLTDYLQSPTPESFDLLCLRITSPQEHITPRNLANNSMNSQPHAIQSPVNRNGLPNFADSPFYRRREPHVATCRLPTCLNNRHEVSTNIQLNSDQLSQLRSNSDLRVLVYCTDHPLPPHTPAQIDFPSQLEVRVNDQEVKANFKRVGRKEGTVKPTDITAFIKKTGGSNIFRIVYARTTKVDNRSLKKRPDCSGDCKKPLEPYQVVIMLADKVPVSSLMSEIGSRVISKETTLSEMKKKARDADIVVGPTTISLKDSASQVRISLPVRGVSCTHQMCFDAFTYLQMQEQAPLWACPICDKPVPLRNIAVDQYFQDILAKTPSSVESVTIQPDGTWTPDKPSESNDYDSDADSVEIVEVQPRAVSSNVAGTPKSYSVATPNSLQSASATRGQKRQVEVIDLTLSDDEDSRPPASKRPRASGGLSESTPSYNGSFSSTPFRPFQLPTAAINSAVVKHPEPSPSVDKTLWLPPPRNYTNGTNDLQNYGRQWQSQRPNDGYNEDRLSEDNGSYY